MRAGGVGGQETVGAVGVDELWVGREDLVRHGQVPPSPKFLMKSTHDHNIW